MPAAEVDVDERLVRSLLAEQHPDLAELPLLAVANGWDNVIFRLGDDLALRVPRRAVAAPLVEHEQRVLPLLAPLLPFAVPSPIRVGRPSDELGYPWAWSVIPWIPGATAADRALGDPRREATRLGEFMAALHVEAPDHAPRNSARGHFVGDNNEILLSRLADLGVADPGDHVTLDIDRAEARWRALLDGLTPWPHAPVWIHGDLHLANVLVADGPFGAEIKAVIDWGDVCGGDPATDLSIAWSLFDEPDRDRFRAAVGRRGPIDDATWRRAEAWALHFAVVYLLHSADNPTMASIGSRLAHSLAIT